MQTYLTYLVLGAGFLVIEMFVPGGILGIIGCVMCLMSAYKAVVLFPGLLGFALALIAIVIALGLLLLVVKFFPKSKVGKNLSMQTSMENSRVSDPQLESLKGAKGVACTALRPGGYAKFGERKVDVISTGAAISEGSPVRVVDVEGNRVLVDLIVKQ